MAKAAGVDGMKAVSAKKILAVDDDFGDLAGEKQVLEKNGYTVVAATNGASALDALEDGLFDLVLVDIKMPTLSGYDLSRLLRERLDGKAKIIFVSVVPKKNVDMKQVDGFVQKPTSAETLLKEVKRVLEK